MSVQAVKKVVIVGGGTAGWMTAAMMARQLGSVLDITLVESDAIGTVGVGEATIPPIQLFNNVLGLDENDFLKKTQGTFKLGIEFSNWGDIGESYMHVFGKIGHDVGMINFYHYWLKARQEGVAGDLWDYAYNYQASIHKKFDRQQKIPNSPMSGLTHAFHFDAGLYAQYLRRYAEAKGVQRVEGKINSVQQQAETGFIQSVQLESAAVVAGDFFIDCSGFKGLLIEDTLQAGYEDYGHWLPCDTAVAVPSETVGEGRPYTQSIAHKAGWQWRIPLQHRTGNGHVFSSQHMSEDEATQTLLDNLEGAPIGEPRTIRYRTGMRKKQWVKNCCAIGLSSGFLEPLESTAIHIIQTSITRMIMMFPTLNFDQADIDEFNRLQAFDFERIRDFIILHYYVTRRSDSDFWNSVRTMEVPETLHQKINMFKSNGRIFRSASDLFSEPAWLQVLYGQGLTPAHYHPIADTLTKAELAEYMNNVKTIIERGVADLPTQADFINRHCSADR